MSKLYHKISTDYPFCWDLTFNKHSSECFIRHCENRYIQSLSLCNNHHLQFMWHVQTFNSTHTQKIIPIAMCSLYYVFHMTFHGNGILFSLVYFVNSCVNYATHPSMHDIINFSFNHLLSKIKRALNSEFSRFIVLRDKLCEYNCRSHYKQRYKLFTNRFGFYSQTRHTKQTKQIPAIVAHE